MIVNFLVTLANETFVNIILDDGNCIVTKNFSCGCSVAGVVKKFTVKCKYKNLKHFG